MNRVFAIISVGICLVHISYAELPIPDTNDKVRQFWQYENCGPKEIKDEMFLLPSIYMHAMFEQAYADSQISKLYKFIFYSDDAMDIIEQTVLHKLLNCPRKFSKQYDMQDRKIQEVIISYAVIWGKKDTKKLISVLPKGNMRDAFISKYNKLTR